MSKVKMTWLTDKMPSPQILHNLYTSIRFAKEKENNLNEDFKIWHDGRTIFIIMDEDKIQNNASNFSFEGIKIKLLRTVTFNPSNFIKGDIVSLNGVINYAYKHYKDENGVVLKKPKESCPVTMKGTLKSEMKISFLEYLENTTGLALKNMTEDKERLRFERLFIDEKDIYQQKVMTKKIMIKNLILISGLLEVIDENKANALAYKMIGKKRSYGFGNMTLEK